MSLWFELNFTVLQPEICECSLLAVLLPFWHQFEVRGVQSLPVELKSELHFRSQLLTHQPIFLGESEVCTLFNESLPSIRPIQHEIVKGRWHPVCSA